MSVQNTIADLEQAVIERLQDRFRELEVEHFPDDPDEFRLNGPVGALLVRYHGGKYSPSMDTDAIVQERAMAFEVQLVFRGLKGDDGAMVYLEAVRRALAGFQPPAFEKIVPAGEEFVSQAGGLWRYAIDFRTSTMAIEEDAPAEVFGGAVTEITIK